MVAGDLQPEGQVLAGPVAHHRTAIPWPQDEGGDDIALPLLALDPKSRQPVQPPEAAAPLL